jgi:alkylation response protein AidB-like acyl-CoA dehydrogenase
MDCYDTALRYAKERIQFDKPIAGTQLQQKKLAEMITEITKAQLLTWRLGVLKMREERQLLKSLWPKETMSTWQLTLHVKQDKY